MLVFAAPAEADDFALVRLEGSTEVTRPGCDTVLVMVTMGVLVEEVEDEVDVVDGMAEVEVELELGATEEEDDEGRAEDELEAMAEELETAADDATGGGSAWTRHEHGDQTETGSEGWVHFRLNRHVLIEEAAADETAADDGAIDETTAADETAAVVEAGLRAMVDFLSALVATAAAVDVPIRAESRAAIVAGSGDGSEGSEGSKSGGVQG